MENYTPCWEVDANGTIIEHYLWTVDEIQSAKDSGKTIVDIPWTTSFIKPTYDAQTNTWVEGELQSTILDQARKNKMSELITKCNAEIYGYFSYTYPDDGKTYLCSCDAEAQSNFEKVDRAFEKGRITSYLWTAHDTNGNTCRLSFTATTFDSFYLAHLNHISSAVVKLRDVLEPQVISATTVSDINSIQW